MICLMGQDIGDLSRYAPFSSFQRDVVLYSSRAPNRSITPQP